MDEADYADDGTQAGGAAASADVTALPAAGGDGAAPPGSAQVVMPPVVPPPGAQGGPPMVVAPDGSLMPGAPLGPDGEPLPPPEEEEGLPFETDADGWLELLRDGYLRQLREENEYPEPPAFHRAMHFGAKEGEPVPPGKYPKQALNIQLHLLLRARAGEGCMPQGGGKGGGKKGGHMKGGKGGGYGKDSGNQMLQIPASALPGLVAGLQSGKGGINLQGGGPGQAQLLLEAAKAIVGQSSGGRGQGLNLDWGSLKGGGGKGKGKDKGKSKWTPQMPKSAPY
mmetsp:Transcript_6409/g.11148  ORF Transcript_6409/g.11148 Transcript_6409/m.11148 type:complete len:282 (-) Transcript_6409:73-918(-)